MMKKSTRIIIVMLCVFVVTLTFFLIHDMEKKLAMKQYNDDNQYKDNVSASINDVNVLSNTNTNTNTNISNLVNDIANENVSENNISNPQNTQEIVEDDVSQESSMDEVLNRESNSETAIELVKNKWGESDTSVYYTNEGINANGEYLVAVRSKESTFIMANFKVNIATKDVKIDL